MWGQIELIVGETKEEKMHSNYIQQKIEKGSSDQLCVGTQSDLICIVCTAITRINFF